MPRPRKSPDFMAALIDRVADAFAARFGAKRAGPPPRKKATFSRAGIERIRAAQKKRWAAYRRAKAAGGR
jgi:hypothetical protein